MANIVATSVKSASPFCNDSYFVNRGDLWKNTDDVKDKPGIYAESNTSVSFYPIDNQDLSFVLTHFERHPMTASLAASYSYRVTITYLATYFNAGVVSFSICGLPLAKLDALWPTWHTVNTSEPVKHHVYLNKDHGSACEKLTGGSLVTIGTSYSYRANIARKHMRHNQKFKIFGVSLCRTY